MWLSRLAVKHCRIIENAKLELAQHANILYGDNASGKSSLLEALSVLARGRSFRTTRIRELIHADAHELLVNAQIESGIGGASYPVGIAKNSHETRIRINHADIQQQFELSTHVPLTLIHPGSVELVTGSPALRRAFLDWIAFYRFADFNLLWRQYQRTLKQRNACLRDSSQRHSLTQWTRQLISLQAPLHCFRSKALEALLGALQISQPLLASLGTPRLQLGSGFPAGVDINDEEALITFFRSKAEQELRQGFTQYGAHRADLNILLKEIPAVRIASRGQMKLLAVALLLAQSHAISEEDGKRGIIAIDDLASELDEYNQQALYTTLHTTRQQLLITGTRPEPLQSCMQDARVFHVKQGVFTRV